MKVLFGLIPLLFPIAATGRSRADYLASGRVKGRELCRVKSDFYNDLFTLLDGGFVLETLATSDPAESNYVFGGFVTSAKPVPVALSAPGFSKSFVLSEMDKQGRRVFSADKEQNPAYLAPLFGQTISIRWESGVPLRLEVRAPQALRVTAPKPADANGEFRRQPDPDHKNGIFLVLRNEHTHKKYWLLTPDDGSLKRSDLS